MALRERSADFQNTVDALKAATTLSTIVSTSLPLTKQGNDMVGLCPFHTEKSPSFTVNDTKGFYHCFGCGAHGDVFDWLAHSKGMGLRQAVEHLGGITTEPAANGHAVDGWSPLIPPPPTATRPDLTGFDAVYTYCDTDGSPLFYVRRLNSNGTRRKKFVPLTYGSLHGKEGWFAKHPAAPRPLYGLPTLAAKPHATVIICEGEKATDAAQRALPDYACVSWSAGTANVHNTDWSPLIERSDVYIWPDNDNAGLKAAAEIVKLTGNAKILRVDDLPNKADAADCEIEDIPAWVASRIEEHQRKIKANGHAGTWEHPTTTDRPAIVLQPGKLPTLATQGEAALLASGLPIFQRGRSLVRPIKQDVPASAGRTTVAAGLREIASPSMIDLLAQSADWQVWNARKKCFVPCDPSHMVANIILSRAGQWTLPVVAGVTTTPTLRPDGSVLTEPGYDPATRLYHVKDDNLSVPLPPPTRQNAETALRLLDGLLDGFPFVKPTDRAVALSCLITPVVRGAMSVAPLHAIRASTAGTGKSYLVDVASAISAGRPCPVVAAGQSEEESEKRLTGLIMGGFSLISIDNCNDVLGGDLLCQAIERPIVRLRPLGQSDIVELECRATMFATGNALRVRGDMTRRTIICDLDANMERPETRSFDFDPVQLILENRGKYVSAAITIVRAYQQQGRPNLLDPPASFSEWSDNVRSALVWLNCDDPVTSMDAAREDDPDLTELREVITLWREYLGANNPLTARDISEHAFPTPDLYDVLLRVAGERNAINTTKLGRWLMAHQGRIVDGYRLKRSVGNAHGKIARWILVPA